MELLTGTVRAYAWGSRTTIAELLGQAVPSPHPQAELWLGAHPGGSSELQGTDGSQTPLCEALAANPARQLGAASRRWGAHLPFLLKVLAADEPLSLQAHPDAEQAADGFAREEAAGIALDAPQRNYVDPHHKPELLCALSEFHALAGFRPAHESVELLTALGIPELETYRGMLAAQPDAEGLRALFTTWITLPQPSVDALLGPTTEACIELVRTGHAFADRCRVLLQLAEAHPGDVGVLAAALLNYVVLQPGEGLYLGPGTLHSYLHGAGVEVMANSDNVLRGGLTAKHVDVAELLRVLDFDDGGPAVLTGHRARPHQLVYRTPGEEFELSRLEWSSGESDPLPLAGNGPQVMLCTRGAVRLCAEDGRAVELRRGDAAWLAAADPAVTVCPAAGPVQVFRATTALGP